MVEEHRIINKIVKENQLDFLYNLYTQGVSIGEQNIDLLRKKGYLEKHPIPTTEKKGNNETINEVFLSSTTEKQKKIDEQIDIVTEKYSENDYEVLLDKELEERRIQYGHIFEGRKTEIRREEWMPKSITKHDQAFVDFINSILLNGFGGKKYYRKFQLYCQQAYTWLQEKKDHADLYDEDDIIEYEDEELRRCGENSLYFLNKYAWYKEGSAESGKVKYVAKQAHELMAFLNDSGYSVAIAKGRQIAATTTLMALDVKDVIFKTNHFMKFVTEDVEKAQEIFEDKLKFVFAEIPFWMRPNVLNERDNIFKIGYKSEKGKKEGVGSKILVAAPKRTVIAGGAPQKVKIDEAGNIPILGQMIDNARPTMMWYNPTTKELEIKRQLWFWGCVCAGTKVWTNDGRLVNIEDLKQEEGILGYNGKTANKEPIIGFNPPAKKPCYRITVDGGNYLECSEDHPLLCITKKSSYGKKLVSFVRADSVKVGSKILSINEINVFGNKSVNYARLLGLLIGDGNYSIGTTPRIYLSEKDIYDFVFKTCEENGIIAKEYKAKKLKSGKYFHCIGMKKTMNILREHGMYEQSFNTKILPKDIYEWDEKSICELIGGYFDADGNVGKGRIVLTSTNYDILREMSFLLQKIGIHASILKEKRNNKTKISAGQKDYICRLYINNHTDIVTFYNKVGLLNKEKHQKLSEMILINNKKTSNIVNSAEFIDNGSGKGAYFLGKKDLSGLRGKRVKKVEFIGEKEIYNLNAGSTHTYIANGFVTHNTGGELEKGGKAFETEFMAIVKQWKEGDYSSCIIPIFFDWTCRPGATQEDYDREKRVAYSKEGPDAKKAITEFHQSWPSSLTDVFRSGAQTLVDDDYLEQALNRIRSAKKEHRFTLHQSGFFEPVYDFSSPEGESSDTPYKIIGAEFIPTEDIDSRASVTIFLQPEKGWKNRYFQGTDPIDTDTGQSLFASTIWDKYYKTPAAILNWRTKDPKQVFMQSMLLGIYYDERNTKEGVVELVESNRGTSYTQYRESKGYSKNMVLNYQLPFTLQNKTTINDGIGIDNKGLRNTQIINHMHSMIKYFGDRMYHEIIFEQLKTFTCSVTTGGKEVWGPMNKKYFQDDTLFSTTFSYICAEICFPEYEPVNEMKEKSNFRIEYRTVYDKDYKLTRVPVRVKC